VALIAGEAGEALREEALDLRLELARVQADAGSDLGQRLAGLELLGELLGADAERLAEVAHQLGRRQRRALPLVLGRLERALAREAPALSAGVVPELVAAAERRGAERGRRGRTHRTETGNGIAHDCFSPE